MKNGNRNGNGHSGTPSEKVLSMEDNGKLPVIGMVEWFRPGEYDRVEQVLDDLAELGVQELRTGVSWADFHTANGQQWIDWLLPRLAKQVKVLPCFLYTPPSLGIAPKTGSPPRDPKLYADFIDVIIERHGSCFDWVELWNEPNNQREWDWTLDPNWTVFGQMVGGAAYWAKQKGKRTVLGGLSPIDPNWMRLMHERGVLEHIDAVGIHGFPETFDYWWTGWEDNISRITTALADLSQTKEIWITEAGFSTWRYDEQKQLQEFLKALAAPVERLYWYGSRDLDPQVPTVDGVHSDEREYHFGLKRADGTPKLLYRLWASGGLQAIRDIASISPAVQVNESERPTLITGGAGFIGTNLADRLLSDGHPVLLFDNLSRPGVERNWRWLRSKHGDLVQLEVSDVREPQALRMCVNRASQVFHFAAQVAVTTSLESPAHDFDVNARGTLNLLEAVRGSRNRPTLIFTSTNKVYGSIDNLEFRKVDSRYQPVDARVAASGLGEETPLDFHSPYGCSKGAADQYVLDYARTMGIQAVVFRMSCIYGVHQHGTEDQGWVAHLLKRAIQGQPLAFYGDGYQVRDVLYVQDLVDAFLLAQKNIDRLSGTAFNIGGGVENTLSLLELVHQIRMLRMGALEINFHPWRPGDQKYYVSDTSRFREAVGWAPKVGVEEGIGRLYEWLCQTVGESPSSSKIARTEKVLV